MKQTLLQLLALICLNAKALANEPVITMTTAKNVGETIWFSLATKSDPTEVQIDFGDGQLVSKTISTCCSDIDGTILGSRIVKIYGSAISVLNCRRQNLTALDVTKSADLTTLICYSNQLTLLDVSHNGSLAYLDCKVNQLTLLDVTKNTALETLICHTNQLASLDVSHNAVLQELNCYSNRITSLGLTHVKALSSLDCSYNKITSLDVSQNAVLQELNCCSNRIPSLDLTHVKALSSLDCSNNNITSLDVSHQSALKALNYSSNQLTTLNISYNTGLKTLVCNNNQLTTLDVLHNSVLEELECSTNQLTTLDVTHNTALFRLLCRYNQLTTLDLRHNVALAALDCSHNKLTSLNVAPNRFYEGLDCSFNHLTFGTLPPMTHVCYAPQNLINIATSFEIDTPIDLSSLILNNDYYTSYTWKTMSGITLTDEKDYTNNEGIFTFLKIPNEKIYCEMTNATFPALSGTKALKTTFTYIGSTPPAAPLSLHPTPDGFRVSGIEQPADVTITDLTGRVVTTTTVDVGGEVPVGHLKQGNYLVKVNERVLKLIKK